MNFTISAKKNTYLFIIIIGILNTTIALLIYFYFKNTLDQSLYKRNIELAKLEFSKTQEEIKKEINHYKLILNIIKNSSHFQNYVKIPLKNDEKLLIHDFKIVTKTNKNIFQLRYIDKKGFEKIRVDRKKGEIKVIKNLQNKSNRYYYTKTSLLKNNQFYISDFDLNIENKKIQIPFEPTIRVSTPIYTNNIFMGILIINYNAKELIDYISKKRIFDVYYMDKNGNFLLHPNKKKSWSSQLNTNYKVKDEIKNIDQLIKNELKDKNSMYYVNKVSTTDNPFYIIYSIKKDLFNKQLEEIRDNILLVFFIIFLITLPIVFVGSYFQSFQMKILETLIDELPFPIVLKNGSGKFILVNKALVKLFGFTKKQDVLGKNSYDFSFMSLPYTNKQKDNEVLFKEQMKFEDSVILQDNKKLYFDTRLIKISFLNLFNKDFILGIAIDITDLKELNNQLEKRVKQELKKRMATEKQLVQKVKLAEIGNLIDNIILQFEQPLNLISMCIQAIELENEHNKFDKQEILKRINTIKQNTSFLFSTTDDFKTFLSLDKGVELFNVEQIISKVERILLGRIKNNHINLKKDIDKNLNIKGYKNEFSQVILNIINNALDEFESKNKQIKEKNILIEAYSKDNFCIIKIIDNAGGIDEKLLDKIFISKFSSKQKKSMGIGLYICKYIIEKNFKGDLIAYNKDKKATFEIKIPF